MIFIFNRNALLFRDRIKSITHEIIEREVKALKHGKRYLFANRILAPDIVVFEHPKTLGLFDPISQRMGFNKNLMYLAQMPVLKNIIRHELAHYLCHLEILGLGELPNGENEQGHLAHGPGFRQMCQRFSWGEEVYCATADLRQLNEICTGDLESERLMEKIKKLLSLATSENAHEAQQATLRANQLLLKHNLQLLQNLGAVEDREVQMIQLLHTKKINSKLRAIAKILDTFYVKSVLSSNRNGALIEVTGRPSNIKVADYISNFLNQEFERLWKNTQKENSTHRGLRAKNSFFLGLASGYLMKVEKFKHEPQVSTTDLVKLDDLGKEEIRLVYHRLGINRAMTKGDRHSHDAGVKAGHNLNIRFAVTSNKGQSGQFLER